MRVSAQRLLVASGLCLACTAPVGIAHAEDGEVYRWTDAEGNVYFGDEAPDGAEKVQLKELPTMNLPPPPKLEPQVKVAEPQGESYSIVRINSPAPEETFRNIGGQLTVDAGISPKLRDGDTVQVLLNGEPAGNPSTSTRITLNEVWRGEHTLQVVVRNAEGETIQSSEPVKVYVHQSTK